MHPSKWLKPALLSIALSILTGCGGGGDSDSGGGTNSTPSANVAPTVDAGVDQTVDELTEVMLSGSGTDSDGSIASYSWEQTTGTSVNLNAADSANANFTAPDLDADETLTFKLTVTDDDGASANSTTTITIKPLGLSGTITTGSATQIHPTNAIISGQWSTSGNDTVACTIPWWPSDTEITIEFALNNSSLNLCHAINNRREDLLSDLICGTSYKYFYAIRNQEETSWENALKGEVKEFTTTACDIPPNFPPSFRKVYAGLSDGLVELSAEADAILVENGQDLLAELYPDEFSSVTELKFEISQDGSSDVIYSNSTSFQLTPLIGDGFSTLALESIPDSLICDNEYRVRAVATTQWNTVFSDYFKIKTMICETEPDIGTQAFKVTSGSYDETVDNNQACIAEYGNSYQIADWNDIVNYYNTSSSMADFFSAVSMPSPDQEGARSLQVSKDGNELYNSSRHYFITRHDHNKPGYYLSHANIDDHLVDLGSWDGARPVLCKGNNAIYIESVLSDNFNDGDFINNPSWIETDFNDDINRGLAEVVNGELHIKRSGAGGNGGSHGVELISDIDISSLTVITLDVKPVNRSVRSGCGDNCTEHPLKLRLVVEKDDGTEWIIDYGWNYDGAIREKRDLTTSTQISFSVPQGEWSRGVEIRPLNDVPNIVKIKYIALYGSGWDFESFVDNINITGSEISNTNPQKIETVKDAYGKITKLTSREYTATGKVQTTLELVNDEKVEATVNISVNDKSLTLGFIVDSKNIVNTKNQDEVRITLVKQAGGYEITIPKSMMASWSASGVLVSSNGKEIPADALTVIEDDPVLFWNSELTPFGDYVTAVNIETGEKGNKAIEMSADFWNEYYDSVVTLQYQVLYYANYSAINSTRRDIRVKANLAEDDLTHDDYLKTPSGESRYEFDIYSTITGSHTKGVYYHIGPNGWYAQDAKTLEIIDNGGDENIGSFKFLFDPRGILDLAIAGDEEFFAHINITDGSLEEEYDGDHLHFNKKLPYKKPSLSIIAPTEGEQLEGGSTYDIKWESFYWGGGRETEFSYGENKTDQDDFATISTHTIGGSGGNYVGEYTWSVPTMEKPALFVRMKYKSAGDWGTVVYNSSVSKQFSIVGETGPTCDSNNLNLCTTENICLSAGGYWYENACHTEAKETSPPVASFTSDCNNLTCTFNASSSYDPDGSITSYTWSFGDGFTSSGVNAEYSYDNAGSYTVVLTVADDSSLTDAISKLVTVNESVTKEIVTISIPGPSDVNENATAYYNCEVEYDDGSYAYKLNKISIYTGTDYASFTSSTLSTNEVNGDKQIELLCSFSYNGRNYTASKTISIIDTTVSAQWKLTINSISPTSGDLIVGSFADVKAEVEYVNGNGHTVWLRYGYFNPRNIAEGTWWQDAIQVSGNGSRVLSKQVFIQGGDTPELWLITFDKNGKLLTYGKYGHFNILQ